VISETFGTKNIAALGDYSIFVWRSIKSLRRLWARRGLFLSQCEFIGVTSSGIILVSAIFLGAVLGYQLYITLHAFGTEALLGGAVGVSLFRDLAPVMTAIMVTGRAGAAIAAEIATMRVSEQIDAMEIMAVDPLEYLVAPKIIAGIIMVPLLSVFFAAIGSLAAKFVACDIMDLSVATYWTQFTIMVDVNELYHCTLKGAFFGGILTSVGCYCGFTAKGGAGGVGLATRRTVVLSCLSILLVDYILTSFLPFGYNWLMVE